MANALQKQIHQTLQQHAESIHRLLIYLLVMAIDITIMHLGPDEFPWWQTIPAGTSVALLLLVLRLNQVLNINFTLALVCGVLASAYTTRTELEQLIRQCIITLETAASLLSSAMPYAFFVVAIIGNGCLSAKYPRFFGPSAMRLIALRFRNSLLWALHILKKLHAAMRNVVQLLACLPGHVIGGANYIVEHHTLVIEITYIVMHILSDTLGEDRHIV